ncbi:hypothetical protein ACFV6B_10100 [Streptomyces microflavus]|uniref:hypothetical protein n=1 Tax=Streptomyces microflavus TaxID=1919 RepID=UPI00365C0F20
MLHWFAPEDLPRLRMSRSTLDLVLRHAAEAERPPPPPATATRAAHSTTVPHIIGIHLYLEDADGRVLLGLRHPGSAYAGGMHRCLAVH